MHRTHKDGHTFGRQNPVDGVCNPASHGLLRRQAARMDIHDAGQFTDPHHLRIRPVSNVCFP